MIMITAALVIRRLKRDGARGEELAQALFDLMFADIDRNFREQGVGDLSVGKHVKRAAATFIAQTAHLEMALANEDMVALTATIRRNIATTNDMAGVARAVIDYDSKLNEWPFGQLEMGTLPEQRQSD
ncbi:MAG: hypothetical protein H6851_13520 [Geminicoccaceae bacterium]|nr:hypothetical protein [Geminicoccaceae bacterium]MCB9944622.1 hypothetical protein [Geminicoccaceae bacterium]